MKKIIVIVFLFLILPFSVLAFEENASTEKVFKAKVLEVSEERENILPDGGKVRQQNLKLIGLDSGYENQEIEFIGINDFDLIKSNLYNKGNIVMMVASADENGEETFYVTDYVRTGAIWWLLAVFVVTLIIIGKEKGFRSLISLALSFVVIVKYLVPHMISGESILLPTIVGSLLVLIAMMYITEGFNKKSHIAVVSSLFVLAIVMIISWIFVEFTKLSGVSSEEVAYLVHVGDNVINFRGLLLAGIIIGTLGVMDDVIISQVSVVEQLLKANEYQSFKQLFSKAYEVGVSHISSMTNTLFLAYAGASLPLLILFVSGSSAFSSWTQIINNEAIATEIVRTLAGSIGLICAVPISTAIACFVFKKYK